MPRGVPPTPIGSYLQEQLPSRKRGYPAGRVPVAALSLQFDGNDIGREPQRLDDILRNPDSNIGHNRFHLMNKR